MKIKPGKRVEAMVEDFVEVLSEHAPQFREGLSAILTTLAGYVASAGPDDDDEQFFANLAPAVAECAEAIRRELRATN